MLDRSKSLRIERVPLATPHRPGADASRSIELPFELAGRLASIARFQNTTLATVLLAAFATLLHRLTGENELLVGMPVVDHPGDDPGTRVKSVGDALPVRMHVNGLMTFDQLVAQAERERLRAVRNRAAAVEAALFTVPEASEGDSGPPDPYRNLLLGYGVELDACFYSLHYTPGLFEPATIERWLASFAQLIMAVPLARDTPIERLPIVAPAERNRILHEWNPSPRPCTVGPPLCARFEAQAALAPDALAISDAKVNWTYRELNAQANQLARALQHHGILPGDIVGFALDHVPTASLAMLAILKAGAAYLPLDPTYPRERLRFMVTDAQARLVLTNSRCIDGFAELLSAERCVNVETLGLAAYADDDLPTLGGADDLAYVMYTSGTTGRPKGALISARGITNLVLENAALAIAPSDIVAQIANLAFDAATFEIWGALLNGATLAIPTRDIVLEPEALAGWLRERGVSVAFVTSALLRHISREAPSAFATLRCLIAGGDVVDPDAARAILTHGPPERLLNGYGPTETTTFATTFAITATQDGPIPIGRPLSNVQAYILDATGAIVPTGVTGHLYIGGHGLARGYVNDPELTACTFVPHPFSTDPKARLYATGDLARYRADGNIEFLGRRDRQVKIRGFRIELDEVAGAIKALPAIADAVVTVEPDATGEKRIVAYVVDELEPARSGAQLRAALARQLPGYMLPSSIVGIAAIPLGSNGKLDTAALARWGAGELAARAGDSPLETALGGIFAALTGAPAVGRDDDFFALGGHSLLAMRAIARIDEQFGIVLPLRDFFAAPTVAGLARQIAAAPLRPLKALRAPVEEHFTELRPGAGQPRAFPLSAAQHRLWLLAELDPADPAYNVPFAFELRGRLDAAALERALGWIVERHAVLRSTVIEPDGEPASLVRDDLAFALRRVELADPEELAAALLREREAPFDLRADLPIRALLVRRAPDDHVLLLTLHHIATDGWSMGILKRELSAAYDAESANQRPALASPATTYGDFARRHAADLASQAGLERLRYWRELLANAPAPIAFPIPAPSTPPASPGGLRSRRLAAATYEHLRRFCIAQGVTEFSALLAAFTELLRRTTGRRDFIIGSVVANRSSTEFEGLIGFFVNTLPLRARIEGDPSFRELLARAHRSALDAFDHQDVALQTLVELVRPARVATGTPLINVLFVLQNAPAAELAFAGLAVTPIALERTTAKFDLTLEVTPVGAELELAFEYRTSLLDAAAIDALLAALERLLIEALRDPDRPLSQLGGESPRAAERAGALETAAETAVAAGAFEPTAFDLAQAEARVALRSIWERVLGVAPIAPSDDFFALGGHSLLAVRLKAEIEKTFGPRLPLSLIFEHPTIERLAQALAAPSGRRACAPVVTYNAGGSRQPFIFLHGSIDGSGAYTRALVDRLGSDRPVHVIGPAGSDGEPLPPTIEAIAREQLGLLRRLQPHGPYLLGGYCAGGLVAFEMARQLRGLGEQVSRVILIDVPDAPSALTGLADAVDRIGALIGIPRHDRLRLTGGLARLPHHRDRFVSSDAKRDFLLGRLRKVVRAARADATSSTVSATPTERRLNGWKRRAEAYVARRYDGALSVLVTSAQGRAAGASGWTRIAPRTEVRVLAGTHHTCITAFIEDTARAVATAIDTH